MTTNGFSPPLRGGAGGGDKTSSLLNSISSLSLIIPAYNEEKRLPAFLRSITDYPQKSLVSEFIVVDDGSSDETSSAANKFSNQLPLCVIKHEANQGKGAAVQTGVMAARGDLVIFIDADGATPISEMPKMIKALTTHDIGIGNRWMAGAKTARHSALRRLSGFTYRTYMKLFGLGAIDTMCGFKGYRREVANKLFANLQEKRWLFDTEVAYKAVQANYRIKNFPISWESKDGSKLDTKTLVMSALQIWPLINRLKD